MPRRAARAAAPFLLRVGRRTERLDLADGRLEPGHERGDETARRGRGLHRLRDVGRVPGARRRRGLELGGIEPEDRLGRRGPRREVLRRGAGSGRSASRRASRAGSGRGASRCRRTPSPPPASSARRRAASSPSPPRPRRPTSPSERSLSSRNGGTFAGGGGPPAARRRSSGGRVPGGGGGRGGGDAGSASVAAAGTGGVAAVEPVPGRLTGTAGAVAREAMGADGDGEGTGAAGDGLAGAAAVEARRRPTPCPEVARAEVAERLPGSRRSALS